MTLVIVALAAHELSCRLTFLAPKLRPLTLNPVQLGECEEAYSLIIYVQGYSYAYSSRRWVNTQMEVLDVLAHHINDQAIDGNLMFLSTHPVALQFLEFAWSASHLRARPEWHI